MGLLATGLLGVASPRADAATITSRSVELTVEGDALLWREELKVRLDGPGDTAAWARFPIYLDEHIELVESRMEVLDGTGKVIESVPRRKFERVESVGPGLYTSGWASIVDFTGLELGHTLRLLTLKRHKPPYPAAQVALLETEPQGVLRVAVRGGPLRWHLRGDPETFRLTETAAGLDLVAEGIEALDPPPGAPSRYSFEPSLLLAWGSGAGDGWAGVGRWYEDFTASVARRDPEVQQRARELTAGLDDPREKVEALAAFVKREVRYEAVQIGVGGWVPTPSGETLDRGWGDCKDKSELLSAMLQAVGIPSHPVLLAAGRSTRVQEEFPSPFQFNHAILAIPAAAAGARAGAEAVGTLPDPVSEDLLFIDPTSSSGGVAWLTPFVQERRLLIVDGGESRLVEAPAVPEGQGRTATITGRVDGEGTFHGQVDLLLEGAWAEGWVFDLKVREASRTYEDFKAVVTALLPGAVIADIGAKDMSDDVPRLLLRAELTLVGAVRGEAGRRWLRPGALQPLPASRLLDDRQVPLILTPGFHRTVWRVDLPRDWCPPAAKDEDLDKDLGRFRSRIAAGEDGQLLIEREALVRRRWIDPTEFDDLRALTVAETRAGKRRIRLRCQEAEESASASTSR